MDYSILANELENLKCLLCNDYLSQFPILQNKKGNICGRCAAVGICEDGELRNQAYETIAGLFKFPCRFQANGCLESMIPEQVPNHEEVCIFRTILCPLKYTHDCNWHGPYNDLVEHFREFHPSFLFTSPTFEMDLVNSYTNQLLLPHMGDLFLLKCGLNATSETYECRLLYLGFNRHPQDYGYQLTIEDPAKKLQMQLPQQNPLKDSAVTEVPVSVIRRELKNPLTVVGRIDIKLMEAAKEAPCTSKQASQSVEILKILECPICLENIVPPIYQCLSGHSICENCQVTTKQCGICQQKFGGTRNYDLEKIATLLSYPCKNMDMGCTYMGKCMEIKQHETICPYMQNCPLKDSLPCNAQMHYDDIYRHVKEEHAEHILDISEVVEVIDNNYLQQTDKFHYIHKIYNKIFKIHYKYDDEVFYWAVELIGDPSECKNYNYEIDIFNSKFPNSRMFIKAPVLPFINKGEDVYFITVYLSQIETLVEEALTYKIRILKC